MGGVSPTQNPLRTQQFPAILLLVAAGLGLLAANTPLHAPIAGVLDAHIAVPGTGIDLSVAHWISDGLLAIFFFVVAMELVYELTRGELNSMRRALQPAIAAAGGVIVPIAVYLFLAGGALEPWVNGAILPVFAFAAAFVVIPQVSLGDLSPAFWAITVALPLGKIIGIAGFGWIAMRIRPRGTPPALVFPDLLAAGALGGIGFTVSLLLANLAFATDAATRDQAILGVLAGSLIALMLCAALVSARAASYRRRAVVGS